MNLENLRAAQEPLLAPIRPDAPSGVDARYDPRHEAIRAEVAKLESPRPDEVKWEFVEKTGEDLLGSTSKDLLIASQVVGARYELRGLAGLTSGLVLLSELMAQHWESMWPPKARERMRANGLSWLLDRVNLTLGETHVDENDRDRVDALALAANAFATVVGEKFTEHAPAVRPLLESIERLRLTLPAKAAAADAAPAPTAAPAPNAPPSPAPQGAPPQAGAPEAAAQPAPAAAPPAVDHGAALAKAVEAWSRPIPGDNPAGADARFDAEYEAVRAEVGQLELPTGGAVDWKDVNARGVRLLGEKSKDLLIATYVAFGLYELRGLDGLAEGLWGLADLQEKFWEGLQPPMNRIRGRANALAWMLDRLEPRLGETPLTANDRDRVERLLAAAKRFAAVTREKFGEQAPGLRPLLDNAERLKVSLPAPAAPAPVAQPQAPAPTGQAGTAAAPMPSAPSATLGSAADSVEFLRKIGESLVEAAGTLRRADPKDAAAYRAIRVGLYLHLTNPPPAQQGNRTGVPAPAAQLRQQLDTLAQNQKWEALLDESESALRQFRFWLDAHRYVALALGGLGEPFAKARTEVLAGASALLRRMPTLASLEFADGSPCASPATRTWIGSELSSGGGGGGDAGPVSSGGDGALVEARKLVAGGKPNEAVALLQKAASGTANGRSQFTTRLETAGVCLGAGKPDLARAIYAGLLEEADRRSLHDWEPALLTDLLTGYHKCLKGLAQAGKPVADELLMVYRRLSRVDLEAAMRVVG